MTGASNELSAARFGASLLALLALATLLIACQADATPTTIPTPAPTANPFLIPGTSEVQYHDEELGIRFKHPDDWSLNDPAETEGVIVTVSSPDGFVHIDIDRDFPPPQIDVVSYGAARMQLFQIAQPAIVIEDEGESALPDGTPAYRARWVSRLDDAETSGETLVVFRGEGRDRETFLVISSGPTALYRAWTGPILYFYETFAVSPTA